LKEALKVGVSGVRGVVGDSLTPQVAVTFAQAFGTFVGRGPVIVGRDTRPTGMMIENAVVAGLESVGCKPVLAGIVPTPSLLVITSARAARGGIAITASHNPAPWNALKFVDRRGMFLDEVRAEELFDIYHQGDFPLVAEDEIPRVEVEKAAFEEHARRIAAYVDMESIRRAHFRVAVDCCNGVGALWSRRFLEESLGCRVVAVFERPTGDFEREPEPLPQNLGSLREAVRKHGCDIGFAQDPDGDRLAIVDEQGEPIGEDLTLAFAVEEVLDRHEKGPVVVNLSTSRSVEDVARSRGCEIERTKIGEINVTSRMLERRAVVGGESNGGVIVPAIHPCRDSFAGMALVLELMAATGRTVSELRAAIPRYTLIKDKIPIRTERAPLILRHLRKVYAGQRMNLIDGVYVELGRSWIHVRRSNTEPVMRLTIEAPDRREAQRLASEVRAEVEQAARQG